VAAVIGDLPQIFAVAAVGSVFSNKVELEV
jgi:hypothetical protein